MGHPGYGSGGPYQPEQPSQAPQQPSWGEQSATPPVWGAETQQHPQQPPAQQAGGVPASGAPTSGAPASGAPASGAPASGIPGGGAPTSAPAGFAGGGSIPAHTMQMPQVGPPQPPPFGPPPGPPPGPGEAGKSPKAPWTPILAGTTALFFLVAAVMTGLFITKSGDYDDATKTIAKHEKTIDARDKSLDDKKEEIKGLEDDLEEAQDDLDSSRKTSKGLADDKAIISKCLKLVNEFLQALAAQDQAKATKKANELQKPCQRADAAMD